MVAGNLPYYITSPILLHLAASHAALDRAVLMVQREVAERNTGCGPARLRSTFRDRADVRACGGAVPLPAGRVFTAAAGGLDCFPLAIRPRSAELGVEEKSYLAFARKAFAQKRKTLGNNLRAAGYAPAQIRDALARAGIEPTTALKLSRWKCWQAFSMAWRCSNRNTLQKLKSYIDDISRWPDRIG